MVPFQGQRKPDQGGKRGKWPPSGSAASPSLVFGIKEPVLWAQLGRQTFPGKCRLGGDGKDLSLNVEESVQQGQGMFRPSRQKQQGGWRTGTLEEPGCVKESGLDPKSSGEPLELWMGAL